MRMTRIRGICAPVPGQLRETLLLPSGAGSARPDWPICCPPMRSTIAMRIEPRSLLCANAFRVKRGDSAARFPDLERLCEAAGDKSSLAMGMSGLLADTLDEGRVGDASVLASQHLNLLESIGDATLTVGLSFVGILVKAVSGEMTDVLRRSQLTIDLANGDPTKGNLLVNSPLAVAVGARGVAGLGWAFLAGARISIAPSPLPAPPMRCPARRSSRIKRT